MSVVVLKPSEQFIPQSDLLLVSRHENKEMVKQFAEARFKAAYNADVNDFLPNMLALLNNQLSIQASVGYQSAAENRLYLEHYLDQPIESAIAKQLNISTPQRSEILEVGNLASLSPGATRRLILNLACHFQKQGYKWLAITATSHVKNSFEKLNVGLDLHRVCKAKASAVVDTNSNWGSYYEHNPEVYIGDIDAGINVLKNNPVLGKLLARLKTPVSDCAVSITHNSAVKEGTVE
jgi:hypothetical protein